MNILVMIDVQNDFVTGVFGTKEAQEMVERLDNYLNETEYDCILFTMDTHWSDYLETREGKFLPTPHCIHNTDGWRMPQNIYSKIENHKNSAMVMKCEFGSDILSEAIDDKIHEESEDEDIRIDFVGLCTDICVISNIIPVFFDFYDSIKIRLLSTYCVGSTPEKHEKTLEILRGLGIEVV